uniref:Exostosin GT47 domain-containing protein n=1 Tax=Cucumis melo TaxID=3656 RepID=A0A9I9ECA0_CUCME
MKEEWSEEEKRGKWKKDKNEACCEANRILSCAVRFHMARVAYAVRLLREEKKSECLLQSPIPKPIPKLEPDSLSPPSTVPSTTHSRRRFPPRPHSSTAFSLSPVMSALKHPFQLTSSSSSPLCSLRASLLTLAVLTLLSFTYLSFTSLHSSPPSSPSQLPVKLGALNDAADEEISDVYHSPQVFRLNYEEMDSKFKVYIYPDGDPNTFYQTPRKLTGKYASEGYFFQNIRESRFRTEDPDQAHLFFIPISCHKMRGKLEALVLGEYELLNFFFVL